MILVKLYKYKAVNNEGRYINRVEYFESLDSLYSELRKKEYYVVKTKLITKIKKTNIFNKISLKDISVFSRQLYSMLSAGFNISDALEVFNNEIYSKTLKNNMIKVKEDIENGNSFYDSISKYHDLYPVFFLEMIDIGEQSGNLDVILKNLSLYYIKEHNIRKKITSSMIYPAIIFMTTIIAFFYIEVSIVPMFMETFKNLGQDMPIYSRITMNFSKFIVTNWPLVLLSLFIMTYFILKVRKIEKIKLKIDKAKLSMPVVGMIYKKIIGARFSRCLGILQQSGINLIKSIEMIDKVLDNMYIKNKIQDVLLQVEKGNSMADTLNKIHIFPELIISMIFLGEQGGNLEEMMNLSADMYDKEVEDTLEKAVSFIEPLLIVVLGIIVGSIVISIMVPMMKMMQSI
jgi:type IV pilus assembly protein PilC